MDETTKKYIENDIQKDKETRDFIDESSKEDIVLGESTEEDVNDVEIGDKTKDNLIDENTTKDNVTLQSFTELLPRSNSTLKDTQDDTDDNSDGSDEDSVLLKYDEILNRHSTSMQLKESIEKEDSNENDNNNSFGSIDIKRKGERPSSAEPLNDENKNEMKKRSLVRMIRSKCCICM